MFLNPLAATLFLAAQIACGAPGYKQADKTGEAINKVRNDVANIKTAVDASMKALDAIEAAATTNPRKPYEVFAKSIDKVEDAADSAKKHADDMRARGAAYFKQWEDQLGSVQDEEIRKLAQERKAKLQGSFDNIKTAAQAARDSFAPFVADLKDLRTTLSTDLTVQGIDAVKDIFKKSKAAGAEVQKNLDSLITELNSVVAAITPSKSAAK